MEGISMAITIGQLEESGGISTYNAVQVDLTGVERLRQILTIEQSREVPYDEAQEIGNSLIEFYGLLACRRGGT